MMMMMNTVLGNSESNNHSQINRASIDLCGYTATKSRGTNNTVKATAQDLLITSFPFAQGGHRHQNRPGERKVKGAEKQKSCTRPATHKAPQFSKKTGAKSMGP